MLELLRAVQHNLPEKDALRPQRAPPGESLLRLLIVSALLVAGCAAATGGVPEPAARPAHPRYEPTSMDVVQAMLRLAGTTSADVVYDLGCGDGRIVIMAASRFGARGVCVDIDPERIAESRANARAAGVADRIRFLNEDLLTTDLGDATIVTLYLSNELNLRLRPKLERELKPGARVVSHWHAMGDWKPQASIGVPSEWGERYLYLWTIP
jgi:SAM-dependent methyltransferase